MKRLATLLLLVILASMAGFVAPRPASACSCMQLDPTSALAEYHAAFVGTLVDVSGGMGRLGGFATSEDDTVYRFEVEEWVKGDLGKVVDIHSAADGGACGIEVGIGNRAGIFVRPDGAQLASSLCETIDADVLLASLEPLAVGAPGPGVLLVSGNIGGFKYVVLNESGGIMAGVNGPIDEPFEQPWQFAMCPGGNTLVEQWSRRVIVRDLSDLTVARQIELGDVANTTSFNAIRCLAGDGSSILLAGEEWNGNRSINRVFDVSDSLNPTMELPPGQVFLGESFAVVQNYESGDVTLVDYLSGDEVLIHSVQQDESNGDFTGVSSVTIAPNGSSIALIEVRYGGSEDTNSTVAIFSAEGEELNRLDFAGEGMWSNWLDSDRLIVNRSTIDGRSTSTIYSAPTLTVEHELEGWQGYNSVVSGGIAFAVDGGSIVRAHLETGEVEQVTTLPTQFVGPIAVLPADFMPSPDVIGNDAETNTPVTVPPLISDAFGASESVDVTGTARAILGVLLAGGIIVFVLTRRKREVAD